MDDTTRTEYPAMLAYLQPSQAVATLNDRLKRTSKLSVEIADWLQERRKVEDQYVQGLRRLNQFKVPNAASDLGVFQDPWEKVLRSVENIAHSHHQMATRIEKDVELPLRTYASKREVMNMQTIAANLSSMAKEFEDAQDKSDRLARKGGKASGAKVDAAATRLGAASQQWESQAPFIFESLQVLDEQRVNQLRDLLTQLLTHESDQAQRSQIASSEALQTVLEIQTASEVEAFAKRVTDGKVKTEKKAPPPPPSSAGRRSSAVESNTLSPPTTAATNDDDRMSEISNPEPSSQPRLRSRIGTMLGRRRQSIHGGFGPISSGSFSRNLKSSHGRTVSPRVSTNDLSSSNKLPSLAETPDPANDKGASEALQVPSTDAAHEGTNGVRPAVSTGDLTAAPPAVNGNLKDLEAVFDSPLEPHPPSPQEAKPAESSAQDAAAGTKDSEGFTIPPEMNDPISQAQREAAGEDTEPSFKLNIQSTPVAQDDPVAAQAALSNVTNALTQMGMPSRKAGTVRGRRDVRNTIYVPHNGGGGGDSPSLIAPPTPPIPGSLTKSSTLATLTSEASIAGTSDTQSVRSGTSLGTLKQVKHPDRLGPGLHASIIETIAAAFEDGVVKSAKISGEIAFCYNPEEDADMRQQQNPRIKINNFPSLEVIGPNRIFVQNALPDRNDQYTLDLSHLARTSTAFTYRLHTSDPEGADLAAHAPLLVRPVWKPKGDKLELLMHYSLNPSAAGFTTPVTLHNVVIFATYEGARASGAQTKPSGTHLKDKHLVYWRLGDVTLTAEPQKIVCRIIGAENAEPQPGHVEARWEYHGPAVSSPGSPGGASPVSSSLTGISVSRLEEMKGKGREEEDVFGDPFADADAAAGSPALPADQRWVDVPLAYKLVSGKYEAR